MKLQNISVGVRAIVIEDNKVLMVKHMEKGKEFYLFPGGGLECNESVMKAVEREVLEEAQIIVKAKKIIYFREFVGDGNYGSEFYILCQKFDQKEIKLGVDPEKNENEKVLIGVEWLNLEKLSEVNWYPQELKHQFNSDLLEGFEKFNYLGVVQI